MEQVVDQDRYDDDGDGPDERYHPKAMTFPWASSSDGPAPHAGLRVRNLAGRKAALCRRSCLCSPGQVHAG